MNVVLSDEQVELCRAAGLLLNTSRDETETWKLAAELGWFGIGISPTDGGFGGSLADEAALYAVIGQFLGPVGICASALGAQVAFLSDLTVLGKEVMEGRHSVSILLPRGGADVGDVEYYCIGHTAPDLALHITATSVCLFDCKDFLASEVSSLDSQTPIQRVSGRPSPRGVLDGVQAAAVFQRCVLLTGAMLAGISQAALEQSVEYARTREQFGVPIGAFQAVKHRCAEMAVRHARSSAAVAHAVRRSGNPLLEDAVCAYVLAVAAALDNARDNIQNHGASGFAAESEPHHLLKRAHLLDRLGGGTDSHLSWLSQQPAKAAG
jgi:alkylation response protein AidB-like acyl-CoA dehydrogenase